MTQQQLTCTHEMAPVLDLHVSDVADEAGAEVGERRDVSHGDDVHHGSRHRRAQLLQRRLDVRQVVVGIVVVLSAQQSSRVCVPTTIHTVEYRDQPLIIY